MKIRTLMAAALVFGCGFGLTLPQHAAGVDDKEFNALKDLVIKLGQRIDQLEKSHEQDQKTLEQTQKVHQEDQQQIQKLKQQLEETQKTAANAEQKAAGISLANVSTPVATHNLTMVGDAEIQFGKTDGEHGGFLLADFAPIFLFRKGDNLLFEAGFDVTLQNGSVALLNGRTGNSGTQTSVDLSFAQMDYVLNDHVVFVGGDMLLPLGTYTERGAGWINKIPDDPLPRGVLPSSGVGAQLRGAVSVGPSGQLLTYAIYGANGPGSVDGSGNSTTFDANTNKLSNLDLAGNVGIRSDGVVANLHGAPSGGGRFGFFYPWKAHYDLELGISGQSGAWNNAGNRLWSAGVFDGALHVSPYFELKGEYIHSWVETDDVGTLTPHGWWLQGGYKLAGLNLELPVISNLELVGRYDRVSDGLGTRVARGTIGYVYYISNTLQLMGDYEFLHSNDPSQSHNRFVFQMAYGF